jgi:hypothetical protein
MDVRGGGLVLARAVVEFEDGAYSIAASAAMDMTF